MQVSESETMSDFGDYEIISATPTGCNVDKMPILEAVSHCNGLNQASVWCLDCSNSDGHKGIPLCVECKTHHDEIKLFRQLNL